MDQALGLNNKKATAWFPSRSLGWGRKHHPGLGGSSGYSRCQHQRVGCAVWRWGIPGREVRHEELGDQLLQRHREVGVPGAGDEVPLDGCQHTIFHVKVLHALRFVTRVGVLGPGGLADWAGHVLLHERGPVALCGRQG